MVQVSTYVCAAHSGTCPYDTLRAAASLLWRWTGKAGDVPAGEKAALGRLQSPLNVHRGSKRTGGGLQTGGRAAEQEEWILTDRGRD